MCDVWMSHELNVWSSHELNEWHTSCHVRCLNESRPKCLEESMSGGVTNESTDSRMKMSLGHENETRISNLTSWSSDLRLRTHTTFIACNVFLILMYLFVHHDSFICVIWLNQVVLLEALSENDDHVYLWHHIYYIYVFIHFAWLIHMCDMTQSGSTPRTTERGRRPYLYRCEKARFRNASRTTFCCRCWARLGGGGGGGGRVAGGGVLRWLGGGFFFCGAREPNTCV